MTDQSDTTKPETNEKAVAAVARWMVKHGYTTGGADNIEFMLAELQGQIWDRARADAANVSAADEIERLRSGLNDVRRFLENPAWGTIRYMEGSGVYEDRDRAIYDIRYALGEITV